MSNPVIYWVAWMARWNTPFSTHAYSAGVFTCPEKAAERGEAVTSFRGGKYSCQVAPCVLDMPNKELTFNSEYTLNNVYVCSVTHLGVGNDNERCHLVGVFSTQERALFVAGVLYPGWNVHIYEETIQE